MKQAYIFPGQGSQFPGMAKDLYENNATAREMLEKANLDVVIVETGADIHAEFCAKALAKNINVMTDIPVVANMEEADMLYGVTMQEKGVSKLLELKTAEMATKFDLT